MHLNRNSLIKFSMYLQLLKDFLLYILRFFLTKPVYHRTVADVPLVLRVSQFEKPWPRRNKHYAKIN
jgi:hypothetical protein